MRKESLQALAARYPELERLFRKEQRNKNRYYCKLFEAVGAATVLADMEY